MSQNNIPEYFTPGFQPEVTDTLEDFNNPVVAQPESHDVVEEDYIEDTLHSVDATPVAQETTIAQVASNLEDPTETIKVEQPFVNFRATRDTATRVDSKSKQSEFNIAFIAENQKTVQAILNGYNDLLNKMTSDDLVLSQADKDWLEALMTGMYYGSANDTTQKATEREDSEWMQGVQSNDPEKLIRPGRPQQRIEKNRRYSKEELLSYLSRKTGGGGTYDIMLPCSGLWLRLREPSLSEIVTMITQIDANKVKLGMETKGLAFGNDTAIAANIISELALNCVIAANVNFTTPTDLEELISVLDEPLLHYALAAVMYPDGFNYKVPCVANIKNCSEVIEFKMNMSNIIHYDNLKFSKEQRRLLDRRFSRLSTVEEIKAYQDEFSVGDDKVFWFNDIGVKLSIPNLYQRKVYVDSWVTSLIDMTTGIFNEGPEGRNRSSYIDRLNHATKALQFGQWVKGIYERDDEATSEEDQLISDDEDVIKDFLSNTLSKEPLVTEFFEAVSKFSAESLIGLVALYSHDCPSCKGQQGSVLNDRFPHLVPIDVIPVFFTLAGQKVQELPV